MAKKVNKWKIYCETDSKWETVWLIDGAPAPTACPVDTAHTVTANSGVIIDYVSTEEVVSALPQGGKRFTPRGMVFTATKDTTTEHDYEFTEALYLKGGTIETENNVMQDTFDIQIVDVNGIAYPPGTVLVEYIKGYPLISK